MGTQTPSAAPGPATPDMWREKMRLAWKMEDDWQHFEAVVSDPATPARRLNDIARSVLPKPAPLGTNRARKSGVSGGGQCVLEAIAAHPNVPPDLLPDIFEIAPTTASAFCTNPVAPFLLLERPDFLFALGETGQLALLREADLPPVFVPLLQTGAKTKAVKEAARFHVSAAGAIETETDWANEVRNYWTDKCAHASGDERQWHLDLAELGLAPAWAAGNPPVPEPAVFGLRTFPVVEQWFGYHAAPDSPETLALLRHIGPTMGDMAVLARGLRKDATADDLMAILHAPGHERGLVHAAVLRHPAADSNVVSFIATVNVPRFRRLVVEHPHVPPSVLQTNLQNSDPSWRRLARRHENAPLDAAEISLRTYVLRVKEGSLRMMPFVSFAASLHFWNLHSTDSLVQKGTSLWWTERLEAVLIAGRTPSVLGGDRAGRTTDDLLLHLARDGNRLVCGATKTCLADPNYRFVL